MIIPSQYGSFTTDDSWEKSQKTLAYYSGSTFDPKHNSPDVCLGDRRFKRACCAPALKNKSRKMGSVNNLLRLILYLLLKKAPSAWIPEHPPPPRTEDRQTDRQTDWFYWPHRHQGVIHHGYNTLELLTWNPPRKHTHICVYVCVFFSVVLGACCPRGRVIWPFLCTVMFGTTAALCFLCFSYAKWRLDFLYSGKVTPHHHLLSKYTDLNSNSTVPHNLMHEVKKHVISRMPACLLGYAVFA